LAARKHWSTPVARADGPTHCLPGHCWWSQ